MTDKKPTDSEVVKALEEYYQQRDSGYSDYLAYGGKQDENEESFLYFLRDLINLINRLQAENEELKSAINGFRGYEDKIKAEAYKEFAERLLLCYEDFDEINEVILLENLVKAIDDLLKEMVGEDNG